jgi:hypothetical protein
LKIHGNFRKSRDTTGINDTSGKFATGVNNTSINGTVATFATFTAGVVDTGGKFATGVNVTGSNFAARVHQQHRWQIMGTRSNCLHLKVYLKKKFI